MDARRAKSTNSAAHKRAGRLRDDQATDIVYGLPIGADTLRAVWRERRSLRTCYSRGLEVHLLNLNGHKVVFRQEIRIILQHQLIGTAAHNVSQHVHEQSVKAQKRITHRPFIPPSPSSTMPPPFPKLLIIALIPFLTPSTSPNT